MASQWLKARQTKYGLTRRSTSWWCIAVVVVANVLADRYNKSFDATSNKRYSLSEQTQKIVKGLKQNATITYFNQSTRFSEGKDLLDEYANLSPKCTSSMSIRTRIRKLARAAGIRELRHRRRADRRQERDGKEYDGRGHHRRLHPRSQRARPAPSAS